MEPDEKVGQEAPTPKIPPKPEPAPEPILGEGTLDEIRPDGWYD